MSKNSNSFAHFLPSISVDGVIFGFQQNQLKVLLLKFKNTNVWSLSGGFVGEKENLDDAAKRILRERTGLNDLYLEQFYVFGDVNRSDGALEEHTIVNKALGKSQEDLDFLTRRYLTVGYFALVDISQVQVTPGELSDEAQWFDIHEIPTLFLDHQKIIQKALDRLRATLDDKLLAFNLLAETFTMSELQIVYETIMDKKLVRTNFQRKILSLDILERLEKKYSGGAHKAPYVYRLKMGFRY
jgi:ADP-ribose pyrophosphatase YjhB (NUDIX family)